MWKAFFLPNLDFLIQMIWILPGILKKESFPFPIMFRNLNSISNVFLFRYSLEIWCQYLKISFLQIFLGIPNHQKWKFHLLEGVFVCSWFNYLRAPIWQYCKNLNVINVILTKTCITQFLKSTYDICILVNTFCIKWKIIFNFAIF